MARRHQDQSTTQAPAPAPTPTPKSATAAPVPEPPWSRPKQAPRAPLTRDAIVDAALAVLDKVGMDGLSMRRVADELGTGAASLYWHVRNKEELFQLIFDRVMEEISLPPPDPSRWQEQLTDAANTVRSVLTRHRDVGRISLGRVPSGPQAVMAGEWFFALLTPLGIPDRAVAYLGDVFGLYVGAYVFEESLGLASPTGEDMPPEQIVEMLRNYVASLPVDRFPNVVRAADLLFSGDREDRWAFGIDLIIRGLESYTQPRRKRRGVPSDAPKGLGRRHPGGAQGR
jgi:TetR/AcrR family tetracycline transcriptional repressor